MLITTAGWDVLLSSAAAKWKIRGKKSFTVYFSDFHGELGLFKADLEAWVWCRQVTQRVLPGNLQRLNVSAMLKASRKRQDWFQLFSFNVTLTFRFSAGSTVEKHSGWRSWQKRRRCYRNFPLWSRASMLLSLFLYRLYAEASQLMNITEKWERIEDEDVHNVN